MRVRRLAAAGTAALLLPFAACSDGESNAEPTQPTTSAAPSPSETAAEGPTLPPEAQGDDEAAAKAFVEFYFELISEATRTGDVSALRGFSAPGCKSCSALIRNISKVYETGGRYESKGWTTEEVAQTAQLTQTERAFVARVRIARRTQFDANGHVTSKTPTERKGIYIVARGSDGSWIVTRWGLVE